MHHHSAETQAVSLAEASCILGYRDHTTVLRLIANGQLQAFRAKTPSGLGAWRISRASIAALLHGQERVGGATHERIPDNTDDPMSGIKSLT
jgi:hypothetical protein